MRRVTRDKSPQFLTHSNYLQIHNGNVIISHPAQENASCLFAFATGCDAYLDWLGVQPLNAVTHTVRWISDYSDLKEPNEKKKFGRIISTVSDLLPGRILLAHHTFNNDWRELQKNVASFDEHRRETKKIPVIQGVIAQSGCSQVQLTPRHRTERARLVSSIMRSKVQQKSSYKVDGTTFFSLSSKIPANWLL